MQLAGRVTGGCESPALAAWLLPGGLSVRCPHWAKKGEARAQSPAPRTRSPEWAPPARPPAGAAPGGSVDRRCRGVFTTHLGLPLPSRACGHPCPTAACALLFMTLGEPLVQQRGDFLGLQFTPAPSQPGEPALAAQAAPADGLCPRGQPCPGHALGPVGGQRVAKRRVGPRPACLGVHCLPDNRPCRGTWPGCPHLHVGLQKIPEA